MQSIVFFISRHTGVLVNARGNVINQFRGFEEIKDTINKVKYGCLQLIVEEFIKVMNGLVMTLEEDKRFLQAALLFANGGAKISIKS